MLDEFKQQYIDKCINGDGMDEELNRLFDKVLIIHFEDNPEIMSEFIQKIVDENTPKEPTEIEVLQKENDMLRNEVDVLWMNITEIVEVIK